MLQEYAVTERDVYCMMQNKVKGIKIEYFFCIVFGCVCVCVCVCERERERERERKRELIYTENCRNDTWKLDY
jgi:hypothetical protein